MHYFIKNYKTILAILLIFVMAALFLSRAIMNATDIKIFLSASDALLQGLNPYNVWGYIYPLTFSFLLVPLSYLPLEISKVLWFVLAFISFSLSGYMLCTIYKELNFSKRQLIIGIACLYLFFYSSLLNHFANGQINLFIIALCCYSFYLFENNKKSLAVVILGLATAIKIIPGIFFIMLIVRKEWKYIFYGGIATIFWLFLPAILTGVNIIEYYMQYLNNFISHDLSNQTYKNSDVDGIVPFNISEFLHYATGLEVMWARMISFCLGIVLFVMSGFLYHLSHHRYKNILLFAIYFIFLLLLTPKLQKHYLVFLLPSVVTLLAIWIQDKQYFTLSVKLLAGCFTFFWICKSIHQGYFYFFAMVSLLAALMLILHNMRKAKPLTQQTSN